VYYFFVVANGFPFVDILLWGPPDLAHPFMQAFCVMIVCLIVFLPVIYLFKEKFNDYMKYKICLEDFLLVFLSVANGCITLGRWIKGSCPPDLSLTRQGACNKYYPGLPLDNLLPEKIVIAFMFYVVKGSSMKIAYICWGLLLLPLLYVSGMALYLDFRLSIVSILLSFGALFLSFYYVKSLNDGLDAAGLQAVNRDLFYPMVPIIIDLENDASSNISSLTDIGASFTIERQPLYCDPPSVGGETIESSVQNLGRDEGCPPIHLETNSLPSI
jgi:hypothetical protein